MIEWPFFDGIDAKSAGAAIGRQDNFVIRAGANETESALAFFKLAEARTDVTLQSTIVDPVPIPPRYATKFGICRVCSLWLRHRYHYPCQPWSNGLN